MNKTIGVIAGTPVDTQMGVDFLLSKGIKAIGFQTANSPKEQHQLQLLHKDKLYDIVVQIILEAKETGIDKFFVYCNSLSAAVDMDKVSEDTDAFIVTPFTAYHAIAKDYSKLLVLAANGQSCAKIETILMETNNDIKMWSISSAPLVEEIESRNTEKDIFQKLAIGKILYWAEDNGVDGIILGCTHFPYISDILLDNTTIPIIDPAEMMLERLLG
ncbi:MAG: aspartate/glutamate racemase family protein [Tissierellaceae bacterium]|nr:aspartate/glutamate racemase family protein [Tissierellaceae bacterium]